jgi:hypothetical protein
VFVFAGYEIEMAEFLKANDGFPRRVQFSELTRRIRSRCSCAHGSESALPPYSLQDLVKVTLSAVAMVDPVNRLVPLDVVDFFPPLEDAKANVGPWR